MSLKEPNSMEECIYFTRRSIGSGKVMAWVSKQDCPKCSKAKMGKPVDPKTGKPKIRATEYVCSSCDYMVDKEEYESGLTCSIKYTCPHCSAEGETEVPFKRKKVTRIDEATGKKEVVDAVRFQCGKCGKNIDITKKMK